MPLQAVDGFAAVVNERIFRTLESIPGAADIGVDRAGASLVRGRLTTDVGHKTYWSSLAFVDLVKDWIAEPQSNHGLLIKADDESIRRVIALAAKESADPLTRRTTSGSDGAAARGRAGRPRER